MNNVRSECTRGDFIERWYICNNGGGKIALF